MKPNEKGHAPVVDEPDIAHAFRMSKRIDKFNDVKLEDISAHTLKIIEIIDEEKNMLEMENQRKLREKLKQLGDG